MGVAPVNIIFVVILSLEAALQCDLTNIIIAPKKLRNKNKKKFYNQ